MHRVRAILSTMALFCAAAAHADLFGTGTNQCSIDFVGIGHAGNAADSSGYGAVG